MLGASNSSNCPRDFTKDKGGWKSEYHLLQHTKIHMYVVAQLRVIFDLFSDVPTTTLITDFVDPKITDYIFHYNSVYLYAAAIIYKQ